MNTKVIRRHKNRIDDGKGYRRMIAGRRFRLPAGLIERDAELRFGWIEELWLDNEKFCRKVGREPLWTDIALWASECFRHGERRVSLPPVDHILASYEGGEWPACIQTIVDHYTDERAACHYPPTVDQFDDWGFAKDIYDVVCKAFPSVPWSLPEFHRTSVEASIEKNARYQIEELAKLKGKAPPDRNTPLVSGSLHKAFNEYEKKRTADFTLDDGSFDGSGHHMIGLVRGFRDHHTNFPLAELDFTRCQELVDYWRFRPSSKHTKETLARKTCMNHIGEMIRFFNWLHLTSKFGWRRPADLLTDLKTDVKKLPSDRKSLKKLEIDRFSIEELTLLYKHAIRFERLLLVWCLNCAHGAAEVGRLEWEDLYLHAPHPWAKEGLSIQTSDEDSWCGFLRPKTDVLGWWYLWPETVTLLEWWQAEPVKKKRRESKAGERVLLTDKGEPLYRDGTRNAQTGFANAWTRLLKRIDKREGEGKVRHLPFGTLRDQLSDWLGGDQNKAVVASVALAHGIPHRGDKLLYRHYSNRPWNALFESQKAYREHLAPMFKAVSNPLQEYDPLTEKLTELWAAGIRDETQLARELDVSKTTIQRRIRQLRLN